MTRRLSGFLGLGLICLAGLILGQNVASADTVTMQLQSPPPGVVAYGVYVDPYYAIVNGVSNTTVICDDFVHDSYANESWTANVFHYDGTLASLKSTQMASVENTTDPTYSNLLQDYEEVAWLSVQLLSNMDDADRIAISFALWGVFDPTGVNAWLVPRGTSLTTLASHWLTDAQTSANLAAGLAALSNITIYSPNGTPQGYSGPPQEFLVVSPEASTLAYLALNFFGLLGVVLVFRRRSVWPAGHSK